MTEFFAVRALPLIQQYGTINKILKELGYTNREIQDINDRMEQHDEKN